MIVFVPTMASIISPAKWSRIVRFHYGESWISCARNHATLERNGQLEDRIRGTEPFGALGASDQRHGGLFFSRHGIYEQ